MDNYGVVEINGVEYYVPINYVEYLCVIDGSLVNVGTGTITLYGSIRDSSNGNSGYPRITAQSFTKAMYQQANGSSTQVLRVNSFEFKNRPTETNTFLLIAIVLVLILSWFKGR